MLKGPRIRAFGVFISAAAILSCSQGKKEAFKQTPEGTTVKEAEVDVVTINAVDVAKRNASLGYTVWAKGLKEAYFESEPVTTLNTDSSVTIADLSGHGDMRVGSTRSYHGKISGAKATDIAVSIEELGGMFIVPVADDEFDFSLTLYRNIPLEDLTLVIVPTIGGDVHGIELERTIRLLEAGNSDVEITMYWETKRWDGVPNSPPVGADVDLHLLEPDPGGGDLDRLFFGDRTSDGGGQLIDDCNHFCEGISPSCNEYISYEAGTPVDGSYIVQVDYWSLCDSGPLDVSEVTVTIDLHGGAGAGGTTQICSRRLLPRDELVGPQNICGFNFCGEGECCTGVPCENPPNDECITVASDWVIREYEDTGTCNPDNSCTYDSDLNLCTYGCEEKTGDDICNPNPCDGVTCIPPDNECGIGGESDRLTTYTGSSCALTSGFPKEAYCEHTYTKEWCTIYDGKGCVDQAGDDICYDPCADTVCNTAPDPTCFSNELRTYSAPGTCDVGDCDYPYTFEICTYGCTNGHCRECADSGDCDTDLKCNAEGFCEGLFLYFNEWVSYPRDYESHEIWATNTDDTDPDTSNWICAAGICPEIGPDELGPISGNQWEMKGPIALSELWGAGGAAVRLAFRYYGRYADNWYIDDICLYKGKQISGYPEECQWSEQFDGVSSPLLPAGWSIMDGPDDASTHDWRTTGNRASSQPQSVYIDYSSVIVDQYLIGPKVELCDADFECCTGVPCPDPSDDVCSGPVLIQYSAGVCDEGLGTCDYPETLVDCDLGCINIAGDDFCAECETDSDCGVDQLCNKNIQVCENVILPKLFFYESFAVYYTYNFHEVLVGPGSSSDPANDSGWVVVADSIDLEPSSDNERLKGPYELDANMGDDLRIAFHYIGYYADNWYLDDICVANTEGSAYPATCEYLFEDFQRVIEPVLPDNWINVVGPTDTGSAQGWHSRNWNGTDEIMARFNYDSNDTADHYMLTPSFNFCPVGVECCIDSMCDNQTYSNYCVNGSTLRLYDTPGICTSERVCDYESSYHDVVCDDGCADAGCNGDPCVDWNTACPPVDICSDTWTTSNQVVSNCTDLNDDGIAECTYSETNTDCPYGCDSGACLSPSCYYDEDSDDDNDVVQQRYSSPPVCWRRCPMPQEWDGASCTGTIYGSYNYNSAMDACTTAGNYHLATLEEFKVILDPCSAASTADWYCEPCSDSLCDTLFPGETGYYASSTLRPGYTSYYYRANFSNGRIEDKSTTSNSYRARCVLE
ncbi:MAG: DUF1566 domain-containing protein [Proteobacteria bacterium]|nr:DUF1566 domain-containing protein [Pseudomonadota bacterium]